MTTRRRPSPSAISYRLVVPAEWRAFDLRSTTAAGAAFIDQLGGARGSQGAGDLNGLVLDTVRSAQRAGARQLFVYTRVINERVAVATLTVAVTEADTQQDHDDLGLLALRLRATDLDDDTVTHDVSIQPTLAGDAVRIERRRTARIDDGEPTEAHEVQYAIPIPHDTRILMLTFSTPNTSAAHAFTTVFDAIAEGLQWTR